MKTLGKLAKAIWYFTRNPVLYRSEIRYIDPFFDEEWYLTTYADARISSLPAIHHYCKVGWKKKYDPSPDFSTQTYLDKNSDVAQSGINPFVHFCRFGRFEGREGLNASQICNHLFEQAANLFSTSKQPLAQDWVSLIVPVQDGTIHDLDRLIESFITQRCSGACLILVDCNSEQSESKNWLQIQSAKTAIHVEYTSKSDMSQAMNAALAHVTTPWISFLQPEDQIAPFGLHVMGKILADHPNLQFAYGDEALIDSNPNRWELALKPAFDPVFLSEANYIGHLAFYRSDRIKEIGGWPNIVNGNPVHTLLQLYLDGMDEASLAHVPYPTYLIPQSRTKITQEQAGHILLQGRSIRQDQVWPKISIIIPNKDAPELIAQILHGLYHTTNYPDFEVLVIDNGTTNKKTLEIYEYYCKEKSFSAHIKEEAFNFSQSINRGLSLATGEHYLLLNNDIEILEPNWLKEMVQCLNYDKVGIVGAKLLYPDRSVQHAGVMIGFGDLAGHWYLNIPDEDGGPLNRFTVRNSLTCVTGAVMLISGHCQAEIGLFDTINFKVAYNDVDYCLRAHQQGYRIIWTPFAKFIHHESASRGSDETSENRARFDQEKAVLSQKYGTIGYIDAASHPLYSRFFSIPHIQKKELDIQPRFWFGRTDTNVSLK